MPATIHIASYLQALAPPFLDPFPAVLLEGERTPKLPGQTAFLNTIVLSKLDGNILDVLVPLDDLVLDVAQPCPLSDKVLDLRHELIPH